MKVVIAGAFGKLGSDITRAFVNAGHEVVAADMITKQLEDLPEGSYTAVKINVQDVESLKGVCDGADAVVTTVGLTTASTTVNNWDIDYQGNVNLLEEAKAAGVKKFVYTSVINAPEGKDCPMVWAKFQFEEYLRASGVPYVIHRPTGYFYDIAHVFWPMVLKNKVNILKGTPKVCNVIDTKDFARFILETINEENVIYNVGGTETYTYQEIAAMFYAANGVEDGPISYAPAWMMDVLAMLPKTRREGKKDLMSFSKFTTGRDCYADTEVPGRSFKEYIASKEYAPVIEAELAAKEAAKQAAKK